MYLPWGSTDSVPTSRVRLTWYPGRSKPYIVVGLNRQLFRRQRHAPAHSNTSPDLISLTASSTESHTLDFLGGSAGKLYFLVTEVKTARRRAGLLERHACTMSMVVGSENIHSGRNAPRNPAKGSRLFRQRRCLISPNTSTLPKTVIWLGLPIPAISVKVGKPDESGQ